MLTPLSDKIPHGNPRGIPGRPYAPQPQSSKFWVPYMPTRYGRVIKLGRVTELVLGYHSSTMEIGPEQMTGIAFLILSLALESCLA